MSTVIEEFVAKLGWDVDTSQLLKVRNSIHGIDKVTSNMAGKLTRGLKKGFFAAAAGAGVLAAGVGWVSKQFSKVEDAEAAFTPLLKGASKAREMVNQLNQTAATTPFQFENLAGVAQQLLPIMNQDIGKTIEFTRMLGDTAGGNAKKMDSITRGFVKSMLKGRVDMESLNMISEAGVPIFQELGVTVGKSGEELFSAMRKGKVSTDDLVNTFKRMTSEGGIYFEGMEIASRTLSGKISTLKDVVSLTAAEVGKVLAPFLKATADELIKLAQKGMDWVKANKELIKTKVTEFIKKIPGYMESIAYWVPKIAKLVGVFYLIAGAVKVSTVAMDAFVIVKALAGKTGPLRKLLSFFGTLLPTEIGKSTIATQGLQGILGKVGLVGGAAAAGWMIGTVIREQILEPLWEAEREADRLQKKLDRLAGKEPEEMNEPELKKAIETAKQLNKVNKEAVQNAQFYAGPAAYGGFVAMPGSAGLGAQPRTITETERKQQKYEAELMKRKQGARIASFMTPQQSGGKNVFVPSSMVTQAAAAPVVAPVNNVTQNVYVTRTGATDREILQATSKGLESALKKTARNYNRND